MRAVLPFLLLGCVPDSLDKTGDASVGWVCEPHDRVYDDCTAEVQAGPVGLTVAMDCAANIVLPDAGETCRGACLDSAGGPVFVTRCEVFQGRYTAYAALSRDCEEAPPETTCSDLGW